MKRNPILTKPFRFAATAAVLLGLTPARSPAQSPAQLSAIMPVDVSPTKQVGDYLNLGWQSFVAVNWPSQAGGIGGQPSSTLSITDPQASTGPTVWLTYLAKEQVFLPNAQDPGTWTNPTKDYPRTPGGLPILGSFTKAGTSTSGEFDEATGNPLIDQRSNFVLYEIRLNQSEFTYLSLTRYYDANNQIAAFPATPTPPLPTPTFVGLPKTGLDLPPPNPPLPAWAQQGALEIKAAWRILVPGKDDTTRFYTRKAYYEAPDGTIKGPFTLGLVGLHILRLTPSTGSTWFWASFEQVDNITQNVPSQSPSFNAGGQDYTNGYSYVPAVLKTGQPLPSDPPVGVSRVTPLPPEVEAINATYQKALAPGVWQHYQMIHVQFPDPNGPARVPLSGNPTNTLDMRNVVMETYSYPRNRNCTDCHGHGFPQMSLAAGAVYGNGGTSGNYQIFTFLLGDARKGPAPAGKP